MNLHAIRAVYKFEMARTWRTLMQSIISPVISTSLYFVVFGAAIGSRIPEVGGGLQVRAHLVVGVADRIAGRWTDSERRFSRLEVRRLPEDIDPEALQLLEDLREPLPDPLGGDR